MAKIIVTIILYDSKLSINSGIYRDMHEINNEPILFKMVYQILKLDPEKIYIVTKNSNLTNKILLYADKVNLDNIITIKHYFTTIVNKINLVIFGVFPYITINLLSDILHYHVEKNNIITVTSCYSDYTGSYKHMVDCGIYILSTDNLEHISEKSCYIVPSKYKTDLYSLGIKNEKIFVNLLNKYVNNG